MGNKFFFLHIPKTGGQSINHFFRQTCTDETYIDHIESLDKKASIKEVLSCMKFASGHIPITRLKGILIPPHEWFLFTFVRDPFSQLLSHLSWVRNIWSNPSIYKRVSEEVQQLSEIFARTDFNNLNQLKSLVENLPDYALVFFDNCQVRYLVDPDPTTYLGEKDCNRAINELSCFDYIGIFEDFENSIKELIYLGFGNRFSDFDIPYKNKNNPKIFEDESLLPSLKEITAHLTQYDECLYKKIIDLRKGVKQFGKNNS